MMKYKLDSNKQGVLDITNIDFAKGDSLVINGIEQLVIDICEASVFTKFNGKEKEYFMSLEGDKTYLQEGGYLKCQKKK